jgi:hypothetical protein
MIKTFQLIYIKVYKNNNSFGENLKIQFMIILQIEHEVPSFEGWKKAFVNDPIDRRKAGVRRYKIYQKTDNPNYVLIDLEFDSLKEAENTFAALQNLWKKVDGEIIIGPKIRILTLVESKEL